MTPPPITPEQIQAAFRAAWNATDDKEHIRLMDIYNALRRDYAEQERVYGNR